MGRAPARRMTAWDDEIINFDTATGSRASFLLMQNVADPEKRGCTLIRVIMGLTLAASSPGSVSGQQKVSCGLFLVSDDAFVASAIPDVDVAADYPMGGYMWRSQYLVQDETLATGPIAPVRIDLDLHAARKVDRASVTMTWTNEPVEGSTFSVRTLGIIRCLYKLP